MINYNTNETTHINKAYLLSHIQQQITLRSQYNDTELTAYELTNGDIEIEVDDVCHFIIEVTDFTATLEFVLETILAGCVSPDEPDFEEQFAEATINKIFATL